MHSHRPFFRPGLFSSIATGDFCEWTRFAAIWSCIDHRIYCHCIEIHIIQNFEVKTGADLWKFRGFDCFGRRCDFAVAILGFFGGNVTSREAFVEDSGFQCS